MTSYSRITPEGTRDLLFRESAARRAAQARLSEIFSLRGYREVMTPSLEYYDVFSLPGASFPQQEMYKSTDNHGRLLVVRPDSTLPIARMAASRLQNSLRPLRLFYGQSIVRNEPDLSGRSDESFQMGVELLGASGLRADLEVISLAVEALSACTGPQGELPRLELGHSQFFRTLAGRLPVPPERKEELRLAIEAKNYGALSSLLDPLEGDPAAEALKRLPGLFGGEEVFEEAEKLYTDGESREVLSYLKRLYTALKKLGLGDRLMVDLGLVQRNDYYTGVVFSAYMKDYGAPLLSGGRYDALCRKFGADLPAVGFALELDAAAALSGALQEERRTELMIFGESGYETEAQKLAQEWAERGRACECSVFESVEETVRYAEKAGISKVILIGETPREIAVKGEKEE